jgi:flavodoxin
MNRRKMLGLIAIGAASMTGLVALDHAAQPSPAGGPVARRGNGSNPDANRSPRPRGDASGILVVYYSKTGANYPDLNLKVGNTAHIAEAIHERVGGDIFEIVPAEAYPTDYDETDQMAQREEANHTYRAIRDELPDTSRYHTVFIGHPIWWGEQPMVVQTFMRDRDLGSANVVPFVTHQGSGFGNTVSVINDYYPNAIVLDGFEARGTDVYEDVDGARRLTNRWLERIGF